MAAAAALLFSSSGRAQVSPDELARRHFESAAAYFEQAEYEEALTAFQKAYELSNRPQILRNISIVQERLGNLAGAVQALDEYLEKAGDDPAIDTMRIRRDNLRQRLEEEQAEERRQQEAERSRAALSASVSKAQREPNQPNSQPQALPPETDQLLPEQPDLVPAYILLSVGGLAGAGALLTGIAAQVEYNKLEGECSPDCADRQTETAVSLSTASTVLTGVSIASLGAGLVWWLTADSAQDEQLARTSLTLDVTPSLGFAEARFTF